VPFGVAQAQDAAPLVIEMKDGTVSPQTIEIAADTAVKLVVRNSGTSAAEFESKRLKQEQVVAPGTEVAIELPSLPAGEYEFVDEFHEDQASAQGVIVVK
jgi:plastocyanin